MFEPNIRSITFILAFLLLQFMGIQSLQAQNLQAIEQNVTEFTLENGLHVIVIQRDVAPVASFVTFVNVGSVNEPVGQTGITHVFEHMAFQGTTTIGTTDWEAEQVVLEELDQAYRQWLLASRSPHSNASETEALWNRFKELEEQAGEFVVNNEFSRIVELEGATGLNAFVSADETAFFYSLPSHKAELWFALEADRFTNPVMREFYSEKNVIMEERRDRIDNNPFGRLIEEFISVAYSAFPYKNHPIGWPSDIEAVTMADALAFYEKHYVPSNMTIAVAGDVDPEQIRSYAERYFGPMPAGEPPPQVLTIEPPQRGERRFVIEEEGQPILMIGYHAVDMNHADAVALDVLSSILFDGRTSRLFRRLVTEEQLALQVGGLNGFPGNRYPGLFLIYAIPNQGVSVDDIELAILDELERVKQGVLTEAELERVVTNARASAIRGLSSNMGMALNFAEAHAQRGSWKELFADIDRMEQVDIETLQQVAQTYFVRRARTVGSIQPLPPAEQAQTTTEQGRSSAEQASR